MALEVPKYHKNESTLELEEMINPMRNNRDDRAVFYTHRKPDYSALKKKKAK